MKRIFKKPVAPNKIETIEEYLARGGQITKIPASRRFGRLGRSKVRPKRKIQIAC